MVDVVGRILKMASPRFPSRLLTNTNLGTTMKGFCRCNSSPKSADIKIQRLTEWT